MREAFSTLLASERFVFVLEMGDCVVHESLQLIKGDQLLSVESALLADEAHLGSTSPFIRCTTPLAHGNELRVRPFLVLPSLDLAGGHQGGGPEFLFLHIFLESVLAS